MRVTANTFPNSLVDQLANLAARQNQYQRQAATGQRIESPSDDPTGMRRVLDLQTEARSVAQYKRNAASIRETAQANYQVLQGLKTISDRAGELATMADGTRSPAELKIYATELTQLIKQAVQLTRTKFHGDYLLSGTRSDQPPFDMTTDAEGNVTAVTYQGNESVNEAEVAEGTRVSAQIIGANSTGVGPRGLISDNRFGADLFNHLISLQNHLLAGDTTAIANTDRANLAKDEENTLLHIGNNGAVQARLEASTGLLSTRAESLEGRISNEADADLAQTLVRLNQTQVAYRAALQSGAELLNQSLLDFLR